MGKFWSARGVAQLVNQSLVAHVTGGPVGDEEFFAVKS